MVAYVGLDVSHATVVACFLLADGREPVPRWTVPNTASGAGAPSRSWRSSSRR